MKEKINYGAIISIVLVCAFLVMMGVNSSTIGDLEDTIAGKDVVIANKDSDITKLSGDITILNQNLVDAQAIKVEVEKKVVEEAPFMYLIDAYFIGGTVSEDLSDRELSIFDGEVEYDDEDYDANEYVVIGGEFVVNEDDMNDNVYMAFNEGDIKYNFVFEDELKFGNESLKFNFLGEEIEVTKWSSDSITVKMADEIIISEGDTISVDNNSILLDMVMEDSIYVTVNGKSEKINEDECEKVDAVEVCVSNVLYSEKDTRTSKAVVSIASEVEEDIDSGDQYGDSEWSWNIDYINRTIGLVLSEEFNDLDEDFMPLSAGDYICLPNEYVCMEFAGLSEEDMSDISFEYDLSDDETKITGEFEAGTEDVEAGTEDVEELIVNSSGMYYEDDDNMVEVTSVNLKNSDVELSYAGNNITLDDIEMNRKLKEVFMNGDTITNEGTYRSNYGSIVEIDSDLESDEDNEVSVSVPEEQLEVSFFMY